MWLDKLRSFLFAETLEGVKLTYGLLKHVEDERDLSFGEVFGAAGYVPKHRVFEIPNVSVKMQQPYNTCCFASATGQKEIDEGKPLSIRSLVIQAKAAGLLSNDGYSTLRNAQEAVRKFGIAEESVFPDLHSNWLTYSDRSQITKDAIANATTHQSDRYFQVRTREEWLMALDSSRPIQTGMDWYTGYQANGGFKAPFVLNLRTGSKIGGHAFYCRGYDLDKGVLKFQNSFGSAYGDNGCFYIKLDDWFRLGAVGYVSVDKVDPASLAKTYEGKDVKADGDPRIFRIVNGQKCWYPNEQIFFSWGGKFNPRTWVLISGGVLNSIPDGPNMTQKV